MLTAVKFKRPGQQNRVYDAETRWSGNPGYFPCSPSFICMAIFTRVHENVYSRSKSTHVKRESYLHYHLHLTLHHSLLQLTLSGTNDGSTLIKLPVLYAVLNSFTLLWVTHHHPSYSMALSTISILSIDQSPLMIDERESSSNIVLELHQPLSHSLNPLSLDY